MDQDTKDYHIRALSGARQQDRSSLRVILRKRAEYFRRYLKTGALTFEYPNWQITLYSEPDFTRVLHMLEENKDGEETFFIPPEKRKGCGVAV